VKTRKLKPLERLIVTLLAARPATTGDVVDMLADYTPTYVMKLLRGLEREGIIVRDVSTTPERWSRNYAPIIPVAPAPAGVANAETNQCH
jgi:hypothetical protein